MTLEPTSYDLTRCGSKEFEHLTQALFEAQVGAGVQIYGSGADGGREATFHGSWRRSESAEWDGYTVLQAKHKEHLSTPRADASWLIGEITSEFAAWEKRHEKGIAIPDFFVVASNVRLAPGDGQGLDAVTASLRSLATKHHLKGFEIWHSDKISRLIDVHDGVRRSYAAWITPGDVLAAMMDRITSDDQDVYDTMVSCLARELLATRSARLDQSGSAHEETIPLSRVFVDLPVSGKGLQHARAVDSIARMGDVKANMPTGEKLKANGESDSRIVFLGGPGQGKSTLMQFASNMYRCRLLQGTKVADLPDVSAAIQDMRDALARLDIKEPAASRWPVHVKLTEYADRLAAGGPDLLGFVLEKINGNRARGLSIIELHRWLRSFPWFISLDGLDEVPKTSNRKEVVAAIANLQIEIASLSADVVIAVSTRPQGYGSELEEGRYRHITLLPLEVPVALNYGSQFVRERFRGDETRVAEVTQRLERAAATEATARLMRSPLQVTILTLLLSRFAEPPREKYALFSEYYRTIVQRELDKDSQMGALLSQHRSDVDAIHASAGIALQLRSADSGGTESRLSHEEFKGIVTTRLSGEGHEGAELISLSKRILDLATERIVFLSATHEDEVGFEIRSLQEFCAAQYISNADDMSIRRALIAIGASAHWRNVSVFVCSRLFMEREHCRDMIVSVCQELNTSCALGEDAAGVIKNGSYLALSVLNENVGRSNPNYRRSFAAMAAELVASPLSFDDVNQLIDARASDISRYFDDAIDSQLSREASEEQWTSLCLLSLLAQDGHLESMKRLERYVASLDAKDLLNCLRAANSLEAPGLAALSVRRMFTIPFRQFAHELRYLRGTLSSYEFGSDGPLSIAAIYEDVLRVLLSSYDASKLRLSVKDALAVDRGNGFTWQVLSPLHGRETWSRLANNGLLSGSWSWLRSVATYAVEPNRSNFDLALSVLRESDLGPLELLYSSLPWPITEALVRSNAGLAPEVIEAEEIAACEESWKKGVSIRDLSRISSKSGGFPFEAARGIYRVGNTDTDTLLLADALEMLQCWTMIKSDDRRKAFARQIPFALTMFVRHNGAKRASGEALTESNEFSRLNPDLMFEIVAAAGEDFGGHSWITPAVRLPEWERVADAIGNSIGFFPPAFAGQVDGTHLRSDAVAAIERGRFGLANLLMQTGGGSTGSSDWFAKLQDVDSFEVQFTLALATAYSSELSMEILDPLVEVLSRVRSRPYPHSGLRLILSEASPEQIALQSRLSKVFVRRNREASKQIRQELLDESLGRPVTGMSVRVNNG